jgi:hypothetical protein
MGIFVLLGILSLVLITCLVIALIIVFYRRRGSSSSHLITYYRINDALDYGQKTIPLNQAMTEVIEEYADGVIVPGISWKSSQFVLFETLNVIDTLMLKTRYPSNVTYINGVCGTDLMASKSSLAYMLRKLPSGEKSIPVTYILSLESDKALLKREFQKGTPYIMKKNVQRQEGYKLVSSLQEVDDVLDGDDAYVVIQKILQNPLLVGGRKVNMRIYMLVVCDAKSPTCQFYFYENGFMYYTRKQFQANTLDPDHIITTGYIDRSVYIENPLTFDDLRKHIGDARYTILFDNITSLMGRVKDAFCDKLSELNDGIPGRKFLVYGCDIAPDRDLNVTIMEINKGPDMSYKDARDREVKMNMVKDSFRIVGLLPQTEEKNRFVRV